MPKITRSQSESPKQPIKETKESKQPKRPSVERSPEQIVIETLAEVLWMHGDISTEHCRREIVKAGLVLSELTPAMIHHAEEMNTEKLREGFRTTNADPKQPVKVVVPGDSEFDPDLNAKHPVRGVAKIKEEQKAREQEQASKPPLKVIRNSGNTPKEEQEQGKQGERCSVQKSKGEGKSKEETFKQRYDLFGHPVTAVLRWMGKDGFNKDEALKALAQYNIDCSPSTVYIQVKAGAKGERGDPAVLTPKEENLLRKAAGRPVE